MFGELKDQSMIVLARELKAPDYQGKEWKRSEALV